jgi:large subunit ribosomal protein L25
VSVVAENALQVEIRETAGKGVARRLRAGGRIPAVCYGSGQPAVSVSVDPTALRKLLERSDTGMNTLINLKGGSVDGRMVLVRELQKDPVRGSYLHADFYEVDIEQTVEVAVPLHIVGKAPGVELGGILDHHLRELELECLPLSIPKELEVDVSGLQLGESVHVRDIVLPEGVTLKSDPDLSVVSVVAPSKAEEEAAVEGAELPEGEVAPEGEAPEKAEAAEGEEKGGDS